VAVLINDLGPNNAQLLAKRDALQRELDNWHSAHKDAPTDLVAYKNFLTEIGYLSADTSAAGADWRSLTADVDAEIAQIAGPQLVVPVDNAHYALNTANARWGSLYKALYGTDVIAEDNGAERQASYNRVHGK
jgi:malate synthase